jgi:hypothetical protein
MSLDAAAEQAGDCLYRRYRQLAMYSPGLRMGSVHKALVALARGGWPAFEECVIEILRDAYLSRHTVHGEVWRIRYATDEGPPARWLPPADITPVFAEHPYLGERSTWPWTYHTVVVVPVTLVPSRKAMHAELDRLLDTAERAIMEHEKARGRGVGTPPPAPYRGERPGRKREWDDMVKLYNEYRDRGEPKQIGRGLKGNNNHKRLLKKAIAWLKPDPSVDDPPDAMPQSSPSPPS